MSFRRTLGLFDSTMVVAGSMIGSGIFIVSADIARQVGSPLMVLVVWALTGMLTIIAALSYGELAGLFPQAGGQYVYLREAYGRPAGFLYGWTLFTVIQTGTIAAVAMAFAKYTSVFFPAVSEKNILLDVGLLNINVSGAQVLAIISIVALTAINSRGLHLGKVIQNTFTTTKIISVVAIASAGLLVGWGSGAFELNLGNAVASQITSDSTMPWLAMIAVAMVGSVFSSDAWNNITFAAAEVREPERTIPRALVSGVLLVTALYMLTNLAYLCVLPLGGSETGVSAAERGIAYATNDRVGAAAAEVMFGPLGAGIMAALIMISTFGCNNGLILSGARAYYAMASDKLFFKSAATLNSAGVPARSLWMQATWASVLCLSGRYGDLLDYVVFAVLLFYVLTIGGIMRLRATRPDMQRPIKAAGYPVLPLLYIAIALGICASLLIYKPQYSWPGLIIVATGGPVYLWWRIRAA